jgi:hypothetical protein
MDSGRDELFTCSCFATQENAGISASHLIDLFQDLPECSAISYKASVATNRLHFLLQIDIFTLKLIAKAPHFLERFLCVIFCAGARERAPDHFNKELQPVYERLWPRSFMVNGPERQRSDDLAPHSKWEGGVGAWSEPTRNFLLHVRFRG